MAGKVGEGKSAGGLSYGYRVPTDDKGLRIKGTLEIHEQQAAVVRRIFADYANGISPLKIATTLNDEGILSPRSNAGEGGHWKQNAINGNRSRGTGILNNELYVGRRIWNRLNYSINPTTRNRVSRLNDESEWLSVDVPQLRIIDEELWNAVKKRQESLSKRRAKDKSAAGNGLGQSQALRRQKYLLSGLLECGQCGGKLTVAGSGERRRYYCANNKEKGVSVCKGMKGLRQTDAESLVLSSLRDELLKDEAYAIFKAAFEAQLKAQTSQQNGRVVLLEQETRELTVKMKNLMATIEAGGNSPTIIKRVNEIEGRLAELSQIRRALTVNAVSLPRKLPSLYRSYVDKLAQTLTQTEVVGRAAEQVRGLIERLVVHYDVQTEQHTIEVSGDLTAMLSVANPSDTENYQQSESSIKLVAGVGFEPTTFRL